MFLFRRKLNGFSKQRLNKIPERIVLQSKKSNIRYVGLQLSPESGGPYKSIQLFQKALGGEIISMVTRSEKNDGNEDQHFEKLISPSEHFGNRTVKQQFGMQLSQCRLLSCHQIFRYHNVLAQSVCKKMSIPYWAVPHGSMDPWVFSYGRLQKELWYRAIGKSYFKNAAHVILATEKERDKMRLRYDGDNMHVVHWPVEPLPLNRQESAKRCLRKRLGLPMEARFLLYFGRYHSMKRPIETIRLFKQANPSERTHLLLVGFDGDLTRGQLEAVADNHPQISVLGPVRGKEREEILMGANAYISLSHRENFNHTAAEAMTGGQALILSPGNDLQFSFPKEKSFGWMLGSDHSDEVIEAIRALDRLEDSALERIGQAGLAWAVEHLAFETFRDKLRALHKEATGSFPS